MWREKEAVKAVEAKKKEKDAEAGKKDSAEAENGLPAKAKTDEKPSAK